MRLCFFLGALILVSVSCGVKQKSVSFGETKKEELLTLRGVPEREETIPVKDSSLVVYSENESYQIQNGVVKASLKSPAAEEKSVMFWKHKLKDCITDLKKVPNPDPHGPAQMELDCASEGIKVVYLEGSETVQKVVEYAKK
jgi:hypothetical protein